MLLKFFISKSKSYSSMMQTQVFLTSNDATFYRSLGHESVCRVHDFLRCNGVDTSRSFVIHQVSEDELDRFASHISTCFATALARERLYQKIDDRWKKIAERDQKVILYEMKNDLSDWPCSSLTTLESLERMFNLMKGMPERQNVLPVDRVREINIGIASLLSYADERHVTEILCGVIDSKDVSTLSEAIRWLNYHEPSEKKLLALERFLRCDSNDAAFLLLNLWSHAKLEISHRKMIAGMCGIAAGNPSLLAISRALIHMEAEQKESLLHFLERLPQVL